MTELNMIKTFKLNVNNYCTKKNMDNTTLLLTQNDFLEFSLKLYTTKLNYAILLIVSIWTVFYKMYLFFNFYKYTRLQTIIMTINQSLKLLIVRTKEIITNLYGELFLPFYNYNDQIRLLAQNVSILVKDA